MSSDGALSGATKSLEFPLTLEAYARRVELPASSDPNSQDVFTRVALVRTFFPV